MRKFIRENFLIILVVAIASLLRFYKLDSYPPALKWDEAALGYNAYSILKTGRDEFGNFLPVIFKSFGDYKPGLYVYADIPFVLIFGLTELATRLPGAIAGILSVLLVYLNVKEIFGKKVAVWPATVLAFSPWHINFSRGAWETNLTVFLLLCGLYLFLKILPQSKEKTVYCPRLSFMSGLFFGLTFITYQGAKVFTPMFLILLVLLLVPKFDKNTRKNLLTGAVSLLIFAIPMLLSIFTAAGGRAKVTNVFSYPRLPNEINLILEQDKTNPESLIFSLFHSETYSFIRGIAERYFNTFSGRYLFFEGDWQNPRLGVPYMGQLYYLDLIFLLLGVYFLIRNKNIRVSLFILLWLFVSPIPAAITRDSVSSVRSLNTVIPLSVIIGLGLCYFLDKMTRQNKLVKLAVLTILIAGYSWNFSSYLDLYYTHAPIHYSNTAQHGYKEVINYVSSIDNKYDKIYFTYTYGQPYIYWLFYTKYPPNKYQQENHYVENKWGDAGTVEHLDNIDFGNVYWPKFRECRNCLYIDDEMGLPENDLKNTPWARVVKRINFLDGSLAFKIVETF